MSKPRYPWWGYIKGVIRLYPKRRGMDLQGTRGKEQEAVKKALDETESMGNGADRLKVIDMVFFKQTHTLDGAALMVPCSYATAKRYHNDFICRVAKNFGLMDER